MSDAENGNGTEADAGAERTPDEAPNAGAERTPDEAPNARAERTHDEAADGETARGVAHARAGLLGNPSDGYGGKVIAVSVRDFRAEVRIEPADALRIDPAPSDQLSFPDLDTAVAAMSARGCEDGLRLLRATLVRIAKEVPEIGEIDGSDPRKRFRMSYETDVPVQVGLSGSSAIVIAALRALMGWFAVDVEPARLAEMALAVEVDELGLAGGPMDRVIQVYEGLLLMDLKEPRSDSSYTRLDPDKLPPLYIAWDPRGGRASSHAHGELRARWEKGDDGLRQIMQEYRDLVDAGVEALEEGDRAGFANLMNKNFAMRATFFPVSERDRQMIMIARHRDASAKLCGSGGAIVGVPRRDEDLENLAEDFDEAGFRMIRPDLGATAG